MPRYDDYDDYDDDDDYDRPRRRRRAQQQPHRGVMILVFAIMGWAVCGIFGTVAWFMGRADLAAMEAGRMDPEGESMTRIGMILGLVTSILMLVGLVILVLYFLFIFVLIAGAK